MSARFLLATIWLFVLLSVASAALWVRSYFYYDEVHYALVQYSGAAAACYEGDLEIYYQSNLPAPWPSDSGWQSWQSRQITSTTQFAPRHRTVFESMFYFHWFNRSFPWSNSPASPKYQVRAVTLPIWTVFLVSAALPTWIYFRGRRKERWQLRKDVRWINPRLHSRVARFSLFSAAGLVVGGMVSWIEVEFRLWRSEWEETLAFALLLPTVCLLVFLTRRRIPFHKALLWMTLELAGSVFFYSFASERTGHFWGRYSFGLENAGQIDLLLFLASFVCAAILLFFFQLKPEPVKPGPYCPQCGYCLIGSPRQICSECGRPFTHDELGVTAEALQVTRLTTG